MEGKACIDDSNMNQGPVQARALTKASASSIASLIRGFALCSSDTENYGFRLGKDIYGCHRLARVAPGRSDLTQCEFDAPLTKRPLKRRMFTCVNGKHLLVHQN